ncbi:peptidase domain-containing ABC transporter [Corallococcus interemptor]|uniref:peptidase domain-containing ABC transporter n=1 Tax=Corallococcus TaxID=83461 RepID=UPI0035D444E5
MPGRSKVPMIFQSEAAECSLACVGMVAGYHGFNVSLAELRKRYPVSLKGLSLRTVMQIGARIGLKARALRCDLDGLRAVAVPAMLHWDMDHFVVLAHTAGDRFTIHDPARGARVVTRTELSEHFTGIVVEMAPTDDFVPAPPGKRLTLFTLLGRPQRLTATLVQILTLSAILELLVLAQPVLIRALVDVGVRNDDWRFIPQVILILALAALLHGGSAFLRDYAVMRAGTSVNLHMMQRLFRHALRLPLPFFEKRPIGHLIERYRVTDEVERFLITSLPLALIDGLMTLLAVGMVFYLAPALGALALTTVVSYLGLKLLGHRMLRAREQALVWAKGEENGFLIETLRTIFTTKVSGLEENRHSVWLNAYGRLIQAQRDLGLVDAGHRGARHALIGFNVAIFMLIAIRHVSTGSLSMGMLLAALFYNSHLLMRSTLLVDRFFEYQLLGVRLERLEDLVFAEPERGPNSLVSVAPEEPLAPSPLLSADTPLTGEIRMEGVSFRYSPDTPLILDDVTCRIAPGEFVALVGDNGAGKTTLLKLLLGLYAPTSGRIFYDGVAMEALPLDLLRSQMGVVTQDDQLFTGTIAQNISLFDPEMNMDHVVATAELACIHGDIERMPMGYSTRIGDLGSPFSEGQKQKFFLARALYRRPNIILMDEGTANLDARSEEAILQNLAGLGAAKLLIAHRSATLRRADRVLLLKDGRLRDVSQGDFPLLAGVTAVTG